MEPKKSKYDTNPLDPDYVKNTEEIRTPEDGRTERQQSGRATREIGSTANEEARQNIYSEAPTRRYDNLPLDAPYQSVFAPPTFSQPASFHTPAGPYQAVDNKPTSRTVAGIGFPEKWAMILPYAPFFIGIVVSLIELFLVPRKEVKVRFHAAQGIALHIAILVVQTLFGVLGAVTDTSIGGTLFKVAAAVFLVISMIRVWNGQPHQIAPIAEPAQWFNEHIEPRNKS
ncbi:MAG TPA: hypothetical protein VGW36_09210 [Pyrinomonadaceae bacterium]|nr:hypothetical protein [Pyrinomonadaceae bacterium]